MGILEIIGLKNPFSRATESVATLESQAPNGLKMTIERGGRRHTEAVFHSRDILSVLASQLARTEIALENGDVEEALDLTRHVKRRIFNNHPFFNDTMLLRLEAAQALTGSDSPTLRRRAQIIQGMMQKARGTEVENKLLEALRDACDELKQSPHSGDSKIAKNIYNQSIALRDFGIYHAGFHL